MKHYFTKNEKILWSASVLLILVAFLLFDKHGWLTLVASLVGVTSLLFAAKGNPIGPLLMIAFSVLYGVISWGFAYYGEVITYLGMTAPMSLFALVSWLKNPYKGNKSQVTVNRISLKETLFMLCLTALVTFAFYFILRYFHTANLSLSTLSVATSFLAVYLTFRRSPYYALAYAANDVVLIVLWILASVVRLSYISVTVCFFIFLLNDLYGFYSWRKMEKRQTAP